MVERLKVGGNWKKIMKGRENYSGWRGSRSLFTVTKVDILIVKNSTISILYRQPFSGRGILILFLA